VVGGHVCGDGLAATDGALLERLIKAFADKAGEAELADVAGKEGGEELPFAEDANQLVIVVDYREGRQVDVEDRLDGALDGGVLPEKRRFADERATDAVWAHRYLTPM
jgi:hypothetical protein